MKFSKKADWTKELCPTCGEYGTTNLTPEQREQQKWECADCANKRLKELEEKEDIEETPTSTEQTPLQEEEDSSSEEISVYHPTYNFLVRLVKLLSKEIPQAIPEIKQLSLQHPFKTVADVEYLTTQIWNLATQKYNIPREWLIKKLPEKKASLNKKSEYIYRAYNPHNENDPTDILIYRDPSLEQLTNLYNNSVSGLRYLIFPQGTIWVWDALELIHQDVLQQLGYDEDSYKDVGQFESEKDFKKFVRMYYSTKKADLWPAQEQVGDMLSHHHNSLSYNPLQEPDTSVSGPNPNEVKQASPGTDHDLVMAESQDIINEYFFQKALRWSQVVSFLKKLVPQLSEADITILKEETKQKLSHFGQRIEAKRKSLNIDKVVQTLDSKEPKVVRVDPTKAVIELEDGTILTFDQATKKAMEIDKEGVFSGSEFSNTDWNVNPTLDLGPFSSPEDSGAKSQKSPWPNTEWLPADDENTDQQSWSNVAASQKPFSKKESSIDTGHGQVPRSEAKWRVLLFDGRGVQYFLDEESANKYYVVALKEDKDPSKPEPYVYKKEAFLKISKPQSGYVDNGKGYTCGRCAYFDAKNNKCALVQGEIKAQGCCNYWDDKTQLKKEGVGYTKEEAVYIEYPNVNYRCDECIFFDSKAKTCTKVEGEISPTASCNLWQPMSKKESFSKKDTILKKAEEIVYEAILNGNEAESFDPVEYIRIKVKDGYNYDLSPEEIQSLIVRKKAELNKKANPSSRYWIAPDGTEFPVGGIHPTWIAQNSDILKQYGIDYYRFHGNTDKEMYKQGWTRVSNEPAGTGFQIQVRDIKNIPSYLDDFVDKFFKNGDTILIGGSGVNQGIFAEITNPFPSLQKAINRYLRYSTTSLKQADISGKVVNDILRLIQETGGATYNFQQGSLVGQDAFAVSTHKDRERVVDTIDFDTLEGYIEDNLDLLNNPSNSFGAWVSGGKVYLDIISVVPTKEEAIKLAQSNNQLAIFDLRNMQEISISMKTLAFSKKELNIVKRADDEMCAKCDHHKKDHWWSGTPEAFCKECDNYEMSQCRQYIPKQEKKAEESILTQEDQNEIAAKWEPIMNLALNNYAQAVKNGHDPIRALKYAEESVINIGGVEEGDLKEAINIYLKGLV